MLKGINQNSKGLLNAIRQYGCLFLCFAEQSPVVFEGDAGILLLNYMWRDAKDNGIIDKDDIVQEHTLLAQNIFKIKARYDGIHHDADENILKDTAFVFGEFFWRSSHFVIINRRKEVIFDPLGYSNTVKNGTLKTMRWYYAV